LSTSEQKAAAEEMLRAAIVEQLDAVSADRQVMLKLSIPTEVDFYRVFVEHPKVLRVVGLSGGWGPRVGQEYRDPLQRAGHEDDDQACPPGAGWG
jgi:fructose-bisphosphate aldolase class 1